MEYSFNTHTLPVGLHPSFESPLPMATWIGIGVAGSAVLTLCSLCACVCVCICRRHRMKVQMKRAFEVSEWEDSVGGWAVYLVCAKHYEMQHNGSQTPWKFAKICSLYWFSLLICTLHQIRKLMQWPAILFR